MIEQVIEQVISDAVKMAYDETVREIKLLLNPRWLSRKDAAAYIGVSVDTFDTIAEKYLTPVIFIGFKLVRYDREQIDKLMVRWQSPPKRTKTK